MCLFCCVAVGLNVSAASVSNTSIELQWSDDTPGVTNFKVRMYFKNLNYQLVLFESRLSILAGS